MINYTLTLIISLSHPYNLLTSHNFCCLLKSKYIIISYIPTRKKREITIKEREIQKKTMNTWWLFVFQFQNQNNQQQQKKQENDKCNLNISIKKNCYRLKINNNKFLLIFVFVVAEITIIINFFVRFFLQFYNIWWWRNVLNEMFFISNISFLFIFICVYFNDDHKSWIRM